jgi:hypothetical protein
MKSKLNKSDFKKRLEQLTSKNKDIFSFTSYNFLGTPFCGKFDDQTFELTRNSFWRYVKAIVIKGEYKESENNSTEVRYEIGWTTLMKVLSIVVNCLGFVVFNAVVIVNNKNLDAQLFLVLLTVNGFIIFGNLWVLTVNWVIKRIINQRFKHEFEIGVEDK